MDNVLLELEKDLEFKARGNKKYEMKAIIDSMIDVQQINNND